VAERTALVNVHVTVLRTAAAKPARPAAAWPVHAFAALLVLAVTVARILYLIFDCPYDLAPDEAHYWDWSRHLDWSYYSKGPLVAWLIRASCAVFGETMPAVRLPAVLCGGLTLLGLYLLTWRVYRRPGLALGVVAFALITPALAVCSLLMTIDAPYLCCWTWALVAAHWLVCPPNVGPRQTGLWRWALLGFIVGLGILAKYTMVLFIPSLGLFLLLQYWRLGFDRGSLKGFALMSVVAGVACLPIVIWNAQHRWVTFFHVGRQAGMQNQDWVRWLGPLEFLGGQAGLLLGFAFCWWLAAMLLALRRRLEPESLFLWCLSAPMFVVFLLFSLRTRVEPNWPVAAYFSGMVLAAAWVVQQWHSPARWWRNFSRGCVLAAIILGLGATVLIHHTEWLYPLLPPSDPYTAYANPRVRRIDPTCRMRGFQTLAAEVERVRVELRAKGVEPIIAATSWALPGELAFYLEDHPDVYCIDRMYGGRHSQYDFWRPNPFADKQLFLGRTMICVAFGGLDWPHEVFHYVKNQPVGRWTIQVVEFQGFPDVDPGVY
jgi:dolichyl-phosphate-mannose-protein mannosyltransferase